jgi:cytochrome b involved in lipid metabolism
MKKFVILILLIAGIITTVFFFQRENDPEVASTNTEQTTNENPPEAPPVITPTPETDPNLKTYTMAEVAEHGSDFDNYNGCWTVIHGKVYDITEFADNFKHPGGEMIYQACGKDGTELFETRPEGSGTPHSANAREILEKYYIGDLRK